MANYNLSDIIQGLIDTDEGIIDKLRIRVEELKRGSSSNALVDINTPGRGGQGTLENDLAASHGQCITATSTESSFCLYSGSFSEDLKYGHYALCARIKISTMTSRDVLQLEVVNGSTVIKTVNISGAEFSSNSQYYYIYTTFVYEGDATNKYNLSFRLNTLVENGIKIYFDYAYISMIIPSVYL